MNNKLVAIDPAALSGDSAKYAGALSKKFGFDAGIFIAAVPGAWLSGLRRTAEGTSRELDRARLLEFRKKAKDELLIPVDSLESAGFSESARELISREKILGVILDGDPELGCDVETAVLNAPDFLNPQREAYVEPSIESYVDALHPVIMTSTEIHLIDRYSYSFFKSSRRTESLLAFIECLRRASLNSRRRLSRFVLHFWLMEKDVPSQSAIDDSVRIINARLHDSAGAFLKVNVRRDNPEHARFILGDRGGMQFDHGLLFGLGAPRNLVRYLETSMHTDLWGRLISRQA